MRPPLTTYASLGKEGETRVKKVMAVIREMDKLMDRLDGKRPINALYSTLLNASGVQCDRFNMSEKMAAKFDSGTGPLKEVLS